MTASLKADLQKLKLKIGPYDICAIPTGVFALDGGAMFGTVPKVLWEKSNPADSHNRIQMEARALLLKSKDRRILIDTGNGSDFTAKYGDKLGAKFKTMYNVDDQGPSLLKSLKHHNINPEDITDVILTHLHFDHAGGATTFKDSRIVPTFPKAKYYVQKSNLQTAKNPNVREKASYFPANFQPLIDHNQLVVIDGNEKNIIPHIEFFISNGHTQGHQAVIIEDDNNRLIYCGDVIPTSTHIRSAWIMGYDLNPLQIIEEKLKLLELSQSKKTYYFFEHDPYCDAAVVIPDKTEFQTEEKFWL